jgi:uncharacterized protein YkwD
MKRTIVFTLFLAMFALDHSAVNAQNCWATQKQGIGGGTSDGPSLAAFNNRLFAAWKGVNGDQRMFWSSFDGNQWAPQQGGLGGGSTHGPSLAVFNNQLFAAWKGADPDQTMYWSTALPCPPKPVVSAPPGGGGNPSPVGGGTGAGCAGLAGEELAICNEHNVERDKHGVPHLNWSTDIASASLAWAKGCHKGADGNFCHEKDCGSGSPYGENLSSGWAESNGQPVLPGRTGAQAVDNWYCEIDNYVYSDNPTITGGTSNGCGPDNKVTGHFTQVVWKATTEVGCAQWTCPVPIFKDNKLVGQKTGTLWVCKYKPPGNNTDSNVIKQNVLPLKVAKLVAGGAGARTTTVKSDVDLYDQPGGGGRKIGILRKGQTIGFNSCRPDNWCQVAGGWVWGDFITR